MSIFHTQSHYWLKPVGDNILDPFSKSNREKLKSSLARFEDLGISFEIIPVTEHALDWFIPMYTDLLLDKNNPEIHDIRETVLTNENQYYILILTQNGVEMGGTIFSVKDWYISIAFRAYKNSWNEGVKLRSNPSLLAEYFLASHTKDENIKFISHGKDRNPYGPNSYIGLAAYKLAVGCKVFINSKEDEVFAFDPTEVKTDTLILHRPNDGIRIREATLFVTSENEEKYDQVTKYPNLLKVNTVTI